VTQATGTDTTQWGNADEAGLLPDRRSRSGFSLSSWEAFGLALAVVLALVAMGPSVRSDFLPGDDDYFVRNFTLVSKPSLANLMRLFTVVHRDLYQPVPMLSFAIDTAIFGGRAWGYHLTNVLWHALAAALVWALVRLRWERPLLATMVAVLFAVHPQAVEPVGTITARIVEMGVTFSLAAIVSFLLWSRRSEGEGGWLAAAILFTLLAMMSKVQAGLPVLLLIVAYPVRRRIPRVWWGAWVALASIAMLFIALAIWTTARSGLAEAAQTQMPGTLWGRALMGMGMYLTHYFCPVRLSTWYVTPATWSWSDPLIGFGAVGFVALIVLAVVSYRRRSGVIAVGLTWYLVGVFPFLWASAARNLIAADRYTYLANIGMHLVVSMGAVLLVERYRIARAGRFPAVGLLAGIGPAMVIVLIGMSWMHIGHYRNGLSYYTRVADLYPNERWVHLNVGWELARAGRLDEAERAAHSEADNPRGDKARADLLLGWIAQERGDFKASEDYYRKAMASLPTEVTAPYRLARLLRQMGRADEAVAMYSRALEVYSDHLPSLIELARLNEQRGRGDASADSLRRVLRINPQHVEALTMLGSVILRQGGAAEAERLFRRALEVDPEHVAAHTNLAIVLAQSGRQTEAMQHYDEAILLEPRLISARLNRAGLLTELGRPDQAAHEYGEILAMDPGCLPALEGLQDILMKTSPEEGLARAVRAWELAVKRAGPQPRLKAGLAWAQALAGMVDKAEQNARECLAEPMDDVPIRAHLALAILAMYRNQADAAMSEVEQATRGIGPEASDDLDRAVQAIGLYGAGHPTEPLPYLLAGRILLAQNRSALAARMFADMTKVTKDPIWTERTKRAMDVWQATSRPAASSPAATRQAVGATSTVGTQPASR